MTTDDRPWTMDDSLWSILFGHLVVCRPCPNLKVAGGAHHTSFSYSVNTEHLQDFADMAGIEFLVIDENTRVQEFREKLCWNDLYYHLNKGL